MTDRASRGPLPPAARSRRHPEVDGWEEVVNPRFEHTHDRADGAVERDAAANHRRIAAEQRLPQAIADDDDPGRLGQVLSLAERPAPADAQAPDAKQVGGHLPCAQPRRLAVSRNRRRGSRARAERPKSLGPITETQKIRKRHARAIVRPVRVDAEDPAKAFRVLN